MSMNIVTFPRQIINLNQIDVNSPELPNHRHVDADDPALLELADSIHKNGLLNEPIVWGGEVPGERARFALIAGERRIRAIQILVDRGQASSDLSFKVFYGDQIAADFIAFADNIERKDLTAYEKAAKLADFQDKYELAPKEIAERLQTNPTWIYLSLGAWNTSSDELKDSWRRGLPSATVYELAKLPLADQPKKVKEIENLRAKGGKKGRGQAHRAAASSAGRRVRATPAEMIALCDKLKESNDLSPYLRGVRDCAMYDNGEIGIAEFEEDLL